MAAPLKRSPWWGAIPLLMIGFAAIGGLTAGGVAVTSIDLPQLGIRGNGHLMMMDRNNAEIADILNRWLAERGLWR